VNAPEPQPRVVDGAPERMIASARRAIRAGAEALESGWPERAVLLLGDASELLVDAHLTIQEGLEPDAGAALTRAFREVCHLIADAALLRDPGAARDADLACAPLAEAVAPARRSERRSERRPQPPRRRS
jgi:hypothetical protein